MDAGLDWGGDRDGWMQDWTGVAAGMDGLIDAGLTGEAAGMDGWMGGLIPTLELNLSRNRGIKNLLQHKENHH